MAVEVVFGKNGFYHPAYGRLGRGDNRGQVYSLPDNFKAEGMLPTSAKIVAEDELEEVLDENDQRKPIKPKVVDEAQFAKNVKNSPAPDQSAATQSVAAQKGRGSSKEPLE